MSVVEFPVLHRRVEMREDALAVLRELTGLVERGEVLSIAVAAVEADGAVRQMVSSCQNSATLLGAVELLKADLIAGIIGASDDEMD